MRKGVREGRFNICESENQPKQPDIYIYTANESYTTHEHRGFCGLFRTRQIREREREQKEFVRQSVVRQEI